MSASSGAADGRKPVPHRNMTSFVRGESPTRTAGGTEALRVSTSSAASTGSCCPGHAAMGTHSHFCSQASGDDGAGPQLGEPMIDPEPLAGDDSYDIKQHPAWNPPTLTNIFENNRKWVHRMTEEDPDFFKRQVGNHRPDYLYIGCSDARLSVQGLLGLEQGQLFVHRNIANMVVNTDINFLSVLTYAVEYLKVKEILICGHLDCGGVRAAMRNQDHGGVLEHWVMGIRDVARLHRTELLEFTDREAMHRRLVELNVQEQALKLYANPVVQRNQALHGWPHIHALVYDVSDGLVRELDVDFKQILSKYRHVYSMYSFYHPASPDVKSGNASIVKPAKGAATGPPSSGQPASMATFTREGRDPPKQGTP